MRQCSNPRTAILSAAVLALAIAGGLFVAGCRRGQAPDREIFLAESAEAKDAIQPLLGTLAGASAGAGVTVDYPLAGAVFPPELCAPTFLWRDADNAATEWLVDVRLGAGRHVYALTSGRRPERETDPRCVTNINVWREPAEFASARGWTPDEATWSQIKRDSVSAPATLTVYSLRGADRVPAARGAVTFSTSGDAVGAQVFYRDVPLMPAKTEDGVIKPLAESALPLIQWRLRDLSKPSAPVVMEHMPTCANCHSFSRGGKTLGMDIDGPSGDKGAHVTKDVSPHMLIDKPDVFSWNWFKRSPSGEQSYGMFPRISPDGKYVVASIHESLFVVNYMQYEFLQTFYPTRGILAVCNRETREIRMLPGADSYDVVQANPDWTPDGKSIVFIRAAGCAPYSPGIRPTFAGDPAETRLRYDLWRIPFNDGMGGTPEPIPGASGNGMSRSFPRVSPDGQWIVFVGSANGMLMRPDSKLYIIPAAGGDARELECNTPRMNSWHSWSPNGRWLVFSSKWPSPYTQMYLTHIDEGGHASPPVLVPNSTAANRAVNLPEFAEIAPGGLVDITTPAVDYRRKLDRAIELEKSGKLDEALAEVSRSLELKSNYPETYLALGYLLELKGHPEEGLAQYRKALDIDARFYSAHNNAGGALMRMGRLDDAMDQFRRALAIYPNYEKALVNMGDALNRASRPKEAVEFFRKAVAVDAANPIAHFNWGVSLLISGDPAGAAEKFAKTLELSPDDVEAHSNLAAALTELGRPAEALRHYRRVIELDPDYGPSYALAAWILATASDATLRDGPEALRLAKIAVAKTAGRDPVALDALAAAHAEAGDFAAALSAEEKALVLARASGDSKLLSELTAHLGLFKQSKAVRSAK